MDDRTFVIPTHVCGPSLGGMRGVTPRSHCGKHCPHGCKVILNALIGRLRHDEASFDCFKPPAQPVRGLLDGSLPFLTQRHDGQEARNVTPYRVRSLEGVQSLGALDAIGSVVTSIGPQATHFRVFALPSRSRRINWPLSGGNGVTWT